MTELPNPFLAALAHFFIIELIRALPWPAGWKERKPLSCNTCMAGWAAIAAGLSWHGSSVLQLTLLTYWAAVAGLTLAALALHEWLSPKMPSSFPSEPLP